MPVERTRAESEPSEAAAADPRRPGSRAPARERSMSDGSTLEWVLRSLLRVRSGEDAERVSVDLVRATTTAAWAGLYAQDGPVYRRRCCSPESQEDLSETVPREVVEEVLQGQRTPLLFPGAATRGHLAPDVAVLAPFDLTGGRPGLFALGPRGRGEVYRPEDLALLHRVVDSCAIALQNSELLDRLRSQVFVDFLTRCYNRRGFDEHLRVEMLRARRYQRPLSLLLVDVDHFKWVNDTMGHPAGDYALRQLGQTMLGAFRNTDWVCRYGGDEFAVIFPETPKVEVVRLAERLRVRLGALFPDETVKRALTVSAGVAAYPEDGQSADEILKGADRALYRAKARGRNRVMAA